MRTLDHFLALLAKFSDGIVGARPLPEPGNGEGQGQSQQEQYAPRQDDQCARLAAYDDETRARPPSGSYPAVWPR